MKIENPSGTIDVRKNGGYKNEQNGRIFGVAKQRL